MRASSSPSTVKQFQRGQWPFQATFQTPLKDLERFVSTFISAHQFIQNGCMTIDDYIFESKTLNAFRAQHSVSAVLTHDASLDAEGHQEVEALLRVTLAGWIDFLFIPSPKRFAIYADHDEYTTFYANTKGNLSKIVHPLKEKRFEHVDEYERTFK